MRRNVSPLSPAVTFFSLRWEDRVSRVANNESRVPRANRVAKNLTTCILFCSSFPSCASSLIGNSSTARGSRTLLTKHGVSEQRSTRKNQRKKCMLRLPQRIPTAGRACGFNPLAKIPPERGIGLSMVRLFILVLEY